MNVGESGGEGVEQFLVRHSFPEDDEDGVVAADGAKDFKIVFIVDEDRDGFRIAGQGFQHGEVSGEVNVEDGVGDHGSGFFFRLLVLYAFGNDVDVSPVFVWDFSHAHEFKVAGESALSGFHSHFFEAEKQFLLRADLFAFDEFAYG